MNMCTEFRGPVEMANEMMSQAHSASDGSSPKVSVIIPAYNIASFITEAIESVLSQSYADFEIVVVNDGSPDTEELERVLTPYMDQIVYLKQENQGAGAARNAGLRVARGHYVAFLDGDDVWYPTHLREQIALIESGPGYDLVYADAVNFGEPSSEGRRSMETNPSEGEATFESILGGRCCVITSAVVARREPIIEVGLFDETLRNSQDFDLWLRLAKRDGARINYQCKVSVRRRIYEGSLASDAINSLRGELSVLAKTRHRPDLTPAERATLEETLALRKATADWIIGKRSVVKGDFSAARESFKSAQAYYGGVKPGVVLLLLRFAPSLLQFICRMREV